MDLIFLRVGSIILDAVLSWLKLLMLMQFIQLHTKWPHMKNRSFFISDHKPESDNAQQGCDYCRCLIHHFDPLLCRNTVSHPCRLAHTCTDVQMHSQTGVVNPGPSWLAFHTWPVETEEQRCPPASVLTGGWRDPGRVSKLQVSAYGVCARECVCAWEKHVCRLRHIFVAAVFAVLLLPHVCAVFVHPVWSGFNDGWSPGPGLSNEWAIT